MGIKKPFLLFEVLIALSLMATMICLLFSFMVQSSRVEKKMEKARISILERQHLQIRMQDVFTTLIPNATDSCLYTKIFPNEKTSIIVHFDNGIDPDPLFSGNVIGRIYLDENQDFCLVYWPCCTEKSPSWRKEILFSKVSDFSIQFLKPLESKHATWVSNWSKEGRQLPSIIRLTLKQKDSSLHFAFRLPNINPIPTYTDDASKISPLTIQWNSPS
jgi:hypothetical protein